MNLTIFPSSAKYSYPLLKEGINLGHIVYTNEIPKEEFEKLNSSPEITLLESIENFMTNLHVVVNSAVDYQDLKEILERGLAIIENSTDNTMFKTISIVVKESNKECYEVLGYKAKGYLDSISSYLMIKELH